jgi:hypothetical protein
MSTALQPFVPASLAELDSLSDKLAKSSLIPEALRGKPNDVAVILMTGAELGLGPMLALRSIYVVKGKPSLSADLMGALVQRSGLCEYLTLVESTGKVATYTTRRRGSPQPTTLSWTLAQAAAAGLTNSQTWKAYPDAMLRARCLSALVRVAYPDLLAGVYDPDELADRPASTYIEATAVESSDTFAQPATSEPVDQWRLDADCLLAEIRAAQIQTDLDSLKPVVRMYEAEHPEAFKELVSEWQARAKAIAPPPSRADSIKTRLRKAAAPVTPKVIVAEIPDPCPHNGEGDDADPAQDGE